MQEATTSAVRGREKRDRMVCDNVGSRLRVAKNTNNLAALRTCLRDLTAAYEAETRHLLNRIIAIEAEERRRSPSRTQDERSAP